jgi:SAM-dependent methyltransferase
VAADTQLPALSADAFDAYFGTPRHALIDLLDGLEPHRALEIGCGAGANLAEIRRRHRQCRTVGVERERQAAAQARGRDGIDQLIEGDVLDCSIDFESGHFDLIVLSHVLEHFAEPEQVLARCRGWLRPGGHMLIALPNVRHGSVITELLLRGEFRYRDHGILDRTHLRFYTRRSAIRFLREQGLEPLQVQPEVDGRRWKLLHCASLGLGHEFTAFAYNFLVRAR